MQIRPEQIKHKLNSYIFSGFIHRGSAQVHERVFVNNEQCHMLLLNANIILYKIEKYNYNRKFIQFAIFSYAGDFKVNVFIKINKRREGYFADANSIVFYSKNKFNNMNFELRNL